MASKKLKNKNNNNSAKERMVSVVQASANNFSPQSIFGSCQ